MQALFDEVDSRFDRYLEDLFTLLAQPSVSTTGEGIEQCAELLKAFLEEYGFDATIAQTTNHPLVLAEREGASDGPTVLFYGHYDVQPSGNDADWDSPAFEPTLRDGSIYARGSGDNKGQFMAHVFAVDAYSEVFDSLPINIRLLIEGGEECGSHGLIDYIDRSPELFDVDLVYVSDGSMHDSKRPTVRYGNRGLLSFELTATGPNRELHSGLFGGPVPNPANRLVSVLDSLIDGDRIALEEFYEGIEVSDAERRAVESIPVDAASIKQEIGLDTFSVPDERYYERLLHEPTFTINGLAAGYSGEGMKTIIPKEATAKIDMRLVPNQDPSDLYSVVKNHVDRFDESIEIQKLGTFPPMKTPMDTPWAVPVRDALSRAWDTDPIEIPLHAGGLPAAYFRKQSDVPILIVPYANPDQANHSPNEHLDLDCFRNGIKTSAAFYGLAA